MIDTGADISCIPPVKANNQKPSNLYLQAANGSSIKTFGNIRLQVDLGLRREFEWHFIIAEVQQPIIGADFIAHFDLLVDIKNSRLIDNRTTLKINAIKPINQTCSIKGFKANNTSGQLITPYQNLINEFKSPTEINQSGFIKTSTQHFIEARGPPVFAKARRLCHDKLLAAKSNS